MHSSALDRTGQSAEHFPDYGLTPCRCVPDAAESVSLTCYCIFLFLTPAGQFSKYWLSLHVYVTQPLDDSDEDIIDDVHRANIKAQKGFTNAFFAQAPPRYRKIAQNVTPILVKKEVGLITLAVFLILLSLQKSTPKPKSNSKLAKMTLSLTDFNEPQRKKKSEKSAAKKKAQPKLVSYKQTLQQK
ncbi:hypothetical protein C8R47DRAFT_1075593 [Mycena vitilis]|nr:hypothetical protein C8R47DRAFT_1075593 [Mycena vitilis]